MVAPGALVVALGERGQGGSGGSSQSAELGAPLRVGMSGAGDVQLFVRHSFGEVKVGARLAEVKLLEEGLVVAHPVIESAGVQAPPSLLGGGIGGVRRARRAGDPIGLILHRPVACPPTSAEQG